VGHVICFSWTKEAVKSSKYSKYRLREDRTMFNDKTVYFDFRIIQQADGTQVIDDRIKTPIDSLTPDMQVEYMEVHNQLTVMEGIKRREQAEKEEKRKLNKNPFWRLACFCGLA